MLFLNQWRLPILFMISGMGTAFALSYCSIGKFIRERNIRLGIPLIFGMFFIIPPQVYFERLTDLEFTGSYFNFWANEAFNGIYPVGNFRWHHLWFLPYLLVYSVLLSPIFIFFRDHPEARIIVGLRNLILKRPYAIYLFIVPLYLYESLMEPFFPITHNLTWDWFNFVSSLTLFFYGFVLITLKEVFWETLDRIKVYTLVTGVFAFCGLLVIWLFFQDSIIIHFTEAFLKVTNLWSWILTIFGFAGAYLNKPSSLLKYCNQAVYPYYILHQTVIITLAYYWKDLHWNFATKFGLLVIGTFAISGLIYEFIIRRISLIKPLFGVKS